MLSIPTFVPLPGTGSHAAIWRVRCVRGAGRVDRERLGLVVRLDREFERVRAVEDEVDPRGRPVVGAGDVGVFGHGLGARQVDRDVERLAVLRGGEVDDELPAVGADEAVGDVLVGEERRRGERGDLVVIDDIRENVGRDVFIGRPTVDPLAGEHDDVAQREPGGQRVTHGGERHALAAERADQVLDADDLVVIRQALGRQPVEDEVAPAAGERLDLVAVRGEGLEVRRCSGDDGELDIGVGDRLDRVGEPGVLEADRVEGPRQRRAGR